MSKRVVRLYDTINVPGFDGSPEKIKFINDNFFGTNKSSSLMIRVAATHAGLITRNNGFYLPDKMNEGVKTMVTPYPKPILLHHNSHDDAIGRIVAADYIDTSGALLKKDSKFQDFVDPKKPFISKLELIDLLLEDGYLEDPNFQGLGYASVIAKITDPKAIQKIVDNRYMTVSIGASTDKAICSICKQDWVEEGPCEHRPGKTYDDKMAFIIAGKLIYEELSFVNSPADPFARVIEVQNSVDDIERIELDKEEDEEPISDQYAELYIVTDDNQYAANLLDSKEGTSTEEGVKDLLRDIDNSKSDIHDDSEIEASETDEEMDEDELDEEESSEDAAMRSPQNVAKTSSKKKKKKKKKACDDKSTEEETVNKEDKKVNPDAEEKEIKKEEKVEEKKEDSTEALDTKGEEGNAEVKDTEEKEDKAKDEKVETKEEAEEKVEDKKEEEKEVEDKKEEVEDEKKEDEKEEVVDEKKEDEKKEDPKEEEKEEEEVVDEKKEDEKEEIIDEKEEGKEEKKEEEEEVADKKDETEEVKEEKKEDEEIDLEAGLKNLTVKDVSDVEALKSKIKEAYDFLTDEQLLEAIEKIQLEVSKQGFKDNSENIFMVIQRVLGMIIDENFNADALYEEFIKFFDENKEEFADAKLGTAQRKKLPNSAFCGPNRSFPVPDCAHVTAARRLIGRAKVSSSTKAKILACVSRKAKAMGCNKKADEIEVKEVEKKIDKKEEKVFELNCDMIKTFSDKQLLDGFKLLEAELEERKLQKVEEKIEEKKEDTSKTEEMNKELEELKEQIKELEDQLKSLRFELKDVYSDCGDLEDSKADLLEQLHAERAHRLCDLRILFGEIKHQGELEQKLEEEAEKAPEIVAQSLKDMEEKVNLYEIVEKLDDGMTRKPEGTVNDPTLSNDSEKPKNDNFKRIRDRYQHLLKNSGQRDADTYLRMVKRSGLVPVDFKIKA